MYYFQTLLTSTDKFIDFTQFEDYSGNLSSPEISKAFAYSRIRSIAYKSRKAQKAMRDKIDSAPDDEALASLDTTTDYNVVVNLRIERSFTSLAETKTRISNDALHMLRRKQYANFFTTCGPKYVHMLKRAQEVTAIITFKAKDQYSAGKFAEALRLHAYGNRDGAHKAMYGNEQQEGLLPSEFKGFDTNLNFDNEDHQSKAMKNSISIEILGYGLEKGLDSNESEKIIAASLDELSEVMQFAYKSMNNISKKLKKTEELTVHQQEAEQGVVFEMTVKPWINNLEFLSESGALQQSSILAVVPYDRIENAKVGTSEPCRGHPESEPDDFGKCCKPSDKVTLNIVNEMGVTTTKLHCEPLYFLPTATMVRNLDANAEFVTWLASVAREKSESIYKLGHCINKLRALPETSDYMFLHSNTKNKAGYDESIDMKYTVKELKAALDPAANLEIVSIVTKEKDEFMEMFYQPCMSALYGMNYGNNNQRTDPKYIMARIWYDLKECSLPKCLESNMAWDRKTGKGCVPGILRRQSADEPIAWYHDPHCAKKLDPETGEVQCKVGDLALKNFITQVDNCREVLPKGKDHKGRPEELSISYLMEYFCMPNVALKKKPADTLKMDEVDDAIFTCVLDMDC